MKKNLIKPLSLLVLGLLLINSCNFYKPVTKPLTGKTSDKISMMDSLSKRTFILHSNQGVYLIEDLFIDLDTETINGILAEVPPENQLYIQANQAKGNKYSYKADEPYVLREVHLYTGVDFSMASSDIGDKVAIPINILDKLEVIERDKEKSTSSTIFTVLGVTAGTLAVAYTVVLLTKNSCPYISAYDGNEYLLQGESFGGAVYPSLAREDFIPLPALKVGSEMKIMIHNELKERQYTDFADLILVSHSHDEHILVDPNGKLKIIKQKISPYVASLNKDKDVLQRLTVTDNFVCNFNEMEGESAINQIVMGFEYPQMIINRVYTLI